MLDKILAGLGGQGLLGMLAKGGNMSDIGQAAGLGMGGGFLGALQNPGPYSLLGMLKGQNPIVNEGVTNNVGVMTPPAAPVAGFNIANSNRESQGNPLVSPLMQYIFQALGI